MFSASVILAVRLFRQVSQYAVNIFFSDQWVFDDAVLFQRHSLWQMYHWQYGPHRQGVGALLSYFLEPYFRWNSRGEAFLATTVVTVAALCAFYLQKRLLGPIRLVDIAIPLIFFTPAQFESLWVTPNFAHGPLPLLLIVLYCLSLCIERRGFRYALVLGVNFLAIYTGFALLIGLITPIWLIFEYYSCRAAGGATSGVLVALAIALGSLASFFLGYQLEPAVDCPSLMPRSPATYVTFFLGVLAHNFGARGPQIISVPLGSTVLVAMIFVLAAFGRIFKQAKSYNAKSLVPAVLAGYCLLFCAATAYGRSCLGSHLAFESRYTNYLELGMLGLYFFFYSQRRQWRRGVSLGLFIVLLLVGSFRTLSSDRFLMERFHAVKSTWRACYLRTTDIQRCDQLAGAGVFPLPERAHLKEKLEFLKAAKLNLFSDETRLGVSTLNTVGQLRVNRSCLRGTKYSISNRLCSNPTLLTHGLT